MNKVLVAIGSVVALGATGTVALADSTLEKVKQRGVIVCGVHEDLLGFGLPDEKGNWSGLDVDFCRAYAAAIFSDPDPKSNFVRLTLATASPRCNRARSMC